MEAVAVPAKRHRPISVTILGWILFLGALVNILFGALFIYASELIFNLPGQVVIFDDPDWTDVFNDREADLVQGIGDIVLGVVQLAIAIGFWRVRRWAWVAAMSWQALKLLFEIGSVFAGGGTSLNILIAIVIVLLLNLAEVRRAFKIQTEDESPVTPIRILDSN